MKQGKANPANPCDIGKDNPVIQEWTVAAPNEPNNDVFNAEISVNYTDEINSSSENLNSFYFSVSKDSRCFSGPFLDGGLIRAVSIVASSSFTTTTSSAFLSTIYMTTTSKTTTATIYIANTITGLISTPTGTPSVSDVSGSSLPLSAILGIAFGIFLILMFALLLYFLHRRRKAKDSVATLNNEATPLRLERSENAYNSVQQPLSNITESQMKDNSVTTVPPLANMNENDLYSNSTAVQNTPNEETYVDDAVSSIAVLAGFSEFAKTKEPKKYEDEYEDNYVQNVSESIALNLDDNDLPIKDLDDDEENNSIDLLLEAANPAESISAHGVTASALAYRKGYLIRTSIIPKSFPPLLQIYSQNPDIKRKDFEQDSNFTHYEQGAEKHSMATAGKVVAGYEGITPGILVKKRRALREVEKPADFGLEDDQEEDATTPVQQQEEARTPVQQQEEVTTPVQVLQENITASLLGTVVSDSSIYYSIVGSETQKAKSKSISDSEYFTASDISDVATTGFNEISDEEINLPDVTSP